MIVGHNLQTYKGFILQESGSPCNLRDIAAQQPLFDQLVADTECTGSADLIACLRTVPFDNLMTAINKSPNFFSYTSVRHGWQPSVDGDFVVRDPQVSLQTGQYAKVRLLIFLPFFRSLRAIFWQVPFVTGDCDDEGTYVKQINRYGLIIYISDSMFSFTTTNITYVLLPYIAPSSAHEIYFFTKSNNAQFLAYIQSRYVT